MPTIIIKKLKTQIQSHPFLYPKSITSNTKNLLVGDLVNINDDTGAEIGLGIFNPNSLYRIRVLWFSHEQYQYTDLPSLLVYRFTQAVALRKHLNLPNAHTNAYRLFNSEADGLSGLTIDVYNNTAIILSVAYWTELHRAAIETALKQVAPELTLSWRAQTRYLQHDGWTETREETTPPKNLIISESDISYYVDLTQGQKSGFFIDQRENRALIRRLSAGKRVLDICCYSGGFALNAAKGGASFVRAIDSSAPAIEWAKQNAELNGLTAMTEFLREDAKNFLAVHDEKYDLVILDPPKLAPSQRDIKAASRMYYKFNEMALQRVEQGGLFLSCSCSSAMTTQFLLELVQQAAWRLKRRIVLLSEQQAAPDHPRLINFPEGEYLTALLFRIE